MVRRAAFGALVALAIAAPHALGGSVEFGGWRANWENGRIDIKVDTVTKDYALIQVFKDFVEPPRNGVFPPLLIDFLQINPDPNTVPRIIINDETISNQTGVPWTDFHWTVANMGDAWFNVPLSAAFDVRPFRSKRFSDPGNVFNDPNNKATDLDAFDGVVPANGSFFPGLAGGELVIDTNLTPQYPVSFTLKEYPTPEPGSILLLSLASAWCRRRR